MEESKAIVGHAVSVAEVVLLQQGPVNCMNALIVRK